MKKTINYKKWNNLLEHNKSISNIKSKIRKKHLSEDALIGNKRILWKVYKYTANHEVYQIYK